MKNIRLTKTISNVHTGDKINYTVRFKEDGYYQPQTNGQTYIGNDINIKPSVLGKTISIPLFDNTLDDLKNKGVKVCIGDEEYSLDKTISCTYGTKSSYVDKTWYAKYSDGDVEKKTSTYTVQINEISSKTKYLLAEKLTLDMFDKTRWDLLKFENYDKDIDSYEVSITSGEFSLSAESVKLESNILSVDKEIDKLTTFTITVKLIRLNESDTYTFEITDNYNDLNLDTFDFTTLNNDMVLTSVDGAEIISDLDNPAIIFNYDGTIYQNGKYRSFGTFYIKMSNVELNTKITRVSIGTGKLNIGSVEYDTGEKKYSLTFSVTNKKNTTTDFKVKFSAKGYNDFLITVRQEKVIPVTFEFNPTNDVSTSIAYDKRNSFSVSFDEGSVTDESKIRLISNISYNLDSIKIGIADQSKVWSIPNDNISRLSYYGSSLSSGTAHTYTVTITAKYTMTERDKHKYSLSNNSSITKSFDLTVFIKSNTSSGGGGGGDNIRVDEPTLEDDYTNIKTSDKMTLLA